MSLLCAWIRQLALRLCGIKKIYIYIWRCIYSNIHLLCFGVAKVKRSTWLLSTTWYLHHCGLHAPCSWLGTMDMCGRSCCGPGFVLSFVFQFRCHKTADLDRTQWLSLLCASDFAASTTCATKLLLGKGQRWDVVDPSSDWPIRFEAMLTSQPWNSRNTKVFDLFSRFFPPVFLDSRYAIQRCLLLMPSSLLAFFQKTLAGRTGEPIWLSNWRFFCESAESQHSENPMSLSPGVLGSIQETLANLRSRECVEGGCSKCQPQYLKVKHWTLKRGGMKCCWNLHFLSWCLPLSWAFSWGFRGTFWNSPDPARRCETFGCSAFLAFGREGTDVSRVPPCQLQKICWWIICRTFDHFRCLGFQMPSGSSILNAIHPCRTITAKSVVFFFEVRPGPDLRRIPRVAICLGQDCEEQSAWPATENQQWKPGGREFWKEKSICHVSLTILLSDWSFVFLRCSG